MVVLGEHGFVAADLLAHLAGESIAHLAVGSSRVDLCQPDAGVRLAEIFREGDALVFVSALTPDKGKDTATLLKNLTMGAQVAALVDRVRVSHIVNVGSDAVYADGPGPVREDSCAAPNSFHGLMHLTRERMLIEAAARSKAPLMLLRPSLLYGARDTHNGYGPNRFMRTVLAGKPVPLFGGGEEQRDHVYIGDLSAIIVVCLRQQSHGVLNVASGTAVSFADAARLAGELSGRVAVLEPSARANPITHRHFDIIGLIKAFPAFHPTALREGLAASLRDLS